MDKARDKNRLIEEEQPLVKGELAKLTLNSLGALLRRLESLPDDPTVMTIVHYSTAWTEEITGASKTESELATLLEKFTSIAQYIKVTDSKAAISMGIKQVPSFQIYCGTEKVEECQSADMHIFRECLVLADPLRAKTPFTKGQAQSAYPLPTGSLLPIFSTF